MSELAGDDRRRRPERSAAAAESGGFGLSVVIPAYNEARRLPGCLKQTIDYLAGHPRWLPAEILVVDDGSSDGTGAAVKAFPNRRDISLAVWRHPENRGKGAAVRTGFAASRGAAVLLSDADLAAPIEELDRLARHFDPGTVVVGSRAVDRRLIAVRQPWYRDFMGRTFNLMVRAAVLPGIRDTQCGFKLFPGELARAVAAAQRLDGFAYDVEILLLARRWGYEVREVGVLWRHVEASRVSPTRHSIEMFRDLVLLALQRWR